MKPYSKGSQGFTLIELIISAALTVIIFAGVFVGTQMGLRIMNHHKHRSEAITIIQRELEDLKRLPFADFNEDSDDDGTYDLEQDWASFDEDNFYELAVEIDDMTSSEKRITVNVRWRIYDNEFRIPSSYESPSGSGIFYTQEQMVTQISKL